MKSKVEALEGDEGVRMRKRKGWEVGEWREKG